MLLKFLSQLPGSGWPLLQVLPPRGSQKMALCREVWLELDEQVLKERDGAWVRRAMGWSLFPLNLRFQSAKSI